MSADQNSEFVRRALNVLFVSNPRGTSIGILLGVVIDGVFGFLSPLLKGVEWLSTSALKIWHFMGFGVVVMNLPSYLKRSEIDSSIKNAFELIDKQKSEGHVSALQAKQLYVNLLNKVVERVVLDDQRQRQVDRVAAASSQAAVEEDLTR